MQVPNTQLTPNFWLPEFWVGVEGGRAPNELDAYKCRMMAASVLQPTRDKYGYVEITRGFSTPDHNKAVGGADFSHHLFVGDSCAVDVVVGQYKSDPKGRAGVFSWILATMPFSIGELIWYPTTNHFHIALPTSRHAMKVLIKVGPKASGEYRRIPFDPQNAARDARAAVPLILEIDKIYRTV